MAGFSSPDERQEQRKLFEDLNLEKIEQLYVQASENGIEEPIVIALDMRDETSQLVADAAPELTENRDLPEENPALIFVMDIDDAIARLGDGHHQIPMYIERAREMKQLMQKQKGMTLLQYLMISFEQIDCKLRPLPETNESDE